MQKKNLLFIYPKLFTFIDTEIKLLEKEYNIISLNQSWHKRWMLPINFMIQILFTSFNIFRVDTVLISFGGYWSFFPSLFGRILGKKVAIIVHGTDCVSFPEINYGNLRNPIMRFFTAKSYQFANIILPVSESLMYTENNYFQDQTTLRFGIHHHLPKVKTPHTVIPNGLILEDWSRLNHLPRPPRSFVTVMNKDQLERKGAKLIIETAHLMSDFNFFFAGVDNTVYKETPDNVYFLGRLSPKELQELYSKTQFYLQLSNFEGFGVAICEAMLCECIPIVSNVNFLPEIAGASRLVLKKRDPQQLIQIIDHALQSDIKELEKSSRLRIINNFSAQKRKDLLNNVLLQK